MHLPSQRHSAKVPFRYYPSVILRTSLSFGGSPRLEDFRPWGILALRTKDRFATKLELIFLMSERKCYAHKIRFPYMSIHPHLPRYE